MVLEDAASWPVVGGLRVLLRKVADRGHPANRVACRISDRDLERIYLSIWSKRVGSTLRNATDLSSFERKVRGLMNYFGYRARRSALEDAEWIV